MGRGIPLKRSEVSRLKKMAESSDSRYSGQKPVGHFEPNFVCRLLSTRKLKFNDMMQVT